MRTDVTFWICSLFCCAAASCVHGQPTATAAKELAHPSTSAPSGNPPQSRGEVYVESHAPKVDPAGWKFGNRRAPDDRTDAKKKPFDIEAYYKIKRISSPQWSPDGKTVLFTVADQDLEKGKTDVDIFRVNADGSDLRQLTRFEGGDSTPRWAPDGRSFMFVSSRKDGAQIWIMPIDGGEPRQITSVSTGVDQPIWSPDGKKIAFASRVFPEFGADDEKNKQLLDDIQENPIQAHLADSLLYRHWTFYNDGTRNHILVVDVESGDTMDLTPGDWESPVFAFGNPGFAFSPDSSEICFVSNRDDPDAQSWTTNSDLYVVPALGGDVVNLTSDNPAYDGHPCVIG